MRHNPRLLSLVTCHSSLVTALALVFAFASANATPRVPYANDFTARSSGPSPSDRWMETTYVVGPLARNTADVTTDSPYSSATAYQDAWAAKAGWSSGEVAFSVADDGGNAAALANGTGSAYASSTVIVQPLGNEFTSGTLRISVDIRTPLQGDSLNPSGNAMAMVAPVYKAGMDVASSALPIPMRFGPGSLKSGDTWNLRALSRGPAPTTYGQSDSLCAITDGEWIRYEATLDLSAGTYTATFATLGTAHPASDTEPVSSRSFRTWVDGVETTTLSFESTLTAETGGVAGIALFVQGLRQADASAAPMFDNIRVWHDGELVYENDFATRRYRQIAPAGTTSGAYALVTATNAVSSATYSGGLWENNYGVSENSCGDFLPASGANGTVCLGEDGWIRRAGGALFSIINPNKNGGYGWTNGPVLRVTKQSTLGVLAAPLGQTVFSGKVRLYFDLFPGRKSVLGNYTEAYAMCFLSGGGMGTAAYTGSTSRDTIWKGKAICGAGYYCNGSKNQELNPGNICYGAGTLKASYSPTVAATMCYWHRYVVTADLDAKTYRMAVYRLGRTGQAIDSDISGLTPVAEVTTGFMTDAPAGIDSLFIASQGHGNYSANGSQTINGVDYNFGKFPCFDNIRVCLVNADGTDGLELYRCDFSGSVRRFERAVAPLAAGMDHEGADRWTRRGAPYGLALVQDDGAGNATAVLGGMNGGAGYAVQPLGATSRNCASAKISADIRPPRFWSRVDGAVLVELGDDEYMQGVNSPAGAWRGTAPRISVGFSCDTSTKTFGRYESVKAAAGTQSGLSLSDVAVDPAHWYRFRVKAELAAGTFAVKVYDQGTAHPGADDADGALVASFANLSMPSLGPLGLTTFGLGGSGIPATFGGGVTDPTAALVDNLAAEFIAAGSLYIFR